MFALEAHIAYSAKRRQYGSARTTREDRLACPSCQTARLGCHLVIKAMEPDLDKQHGFPATLTDPCATPVEALCEKRKHPIAPKQERDRRVLEAFIDDRRNKENATSHEKLRRRRT